MKIKADKVSLVRVFHGAMFLMAVGTGAPASLAPAPASAEPALKNASGMFIEDLAQAKEGQSGDTARCPLITSIACGEEAVKCIGC